MTTEVDLRDQILHKNSQEKRVFLQKFYTDVYKTNAYRPINAYSIWMKLLRDFPPFKTREVPFKKGLEVGCGIGIGVSLANLMGHDVWGLDLADAREYWKGFDIDSKCVVASALDIPFQDGAFDFIVTPDVMEHIPENDIEGVLQEIWRVGSNEYFFVIHTTTENQPASFIIDGEELKFYTHICQQVPGWWLNKIHNLDYKVISYSIQKDHVIIYCSKYKEKKDGSKS